MKKLLAICLLLALLTGLLASCGTESTGTWEIEPGPTSESVQVSDREPTQTIRAFDDVTAGECYLAVGDLTIGKEYTGRTLDFLGSTIRGSGRVVITASHVTVLSLALDGMSLVIDADASAVTVENVHVTGDLTDNASSALVNCSIGGSVTLTSGSILEDSRVLGGVKASDARDLLITKSIVESGLTLVNTRNTVLLLNRFTSPLSFTDCSYLSVVENDFSDQTTPLSYQGGRISLVTGNSGFEGAVYQGDVEKIYGGDIPASGSPDDPGCDFSLLPQVENDRFAGYTPTDQVQIGAKSTPLASYIAQGAADGATLILPPGVYTATAEEGAYFAFQGLRNFRLLAYGAEIIFSSGNLCGFYFDGCDNVKLCGLTTDYAMTPYAQGTVVKSTVEYFLWKPDEGFTGNVDDPTYFDPYGHAEGFREGRDIPYADLSIYSREAMGDGTYKILSADPVLVHEGDKVIFRMKGNHVNIFMKSRGMVYEDVTIYAGALFGVMEWASEGGTVLNRLKIFPGPSPVKGGEERLISTCDATHMTAGRQGPVISNCWFEKMTDDGTNINGVYASLQHYDRKAKQLTIANSSGDGPYTVPIRKGDLLTAVTTSGTLLAEGKAAADSDGTTVKVDFGVELAGKDIIIENLSANSCGFVFENNYIAKIRSRGILIKASGKVSRNTVELCGMAGILVSPEIEGGWGESAFVRGLDITGNLLAGTGIFYYNNPLPRYSPITVYGGLSVNGSAATLPMRDIRITGNCIRNRYTALAVSVDGVNGLTLTDNDFGVRAETDIIRGRTLNSMAKQGDDNVIPVAIQDAANIIFENNRLPASVSAPYAASGIIE